MHWFPKIQISGTGLTLVTAIAPSLGISLPQFLRWGIFALGVFMIIWPIVPAIYSDAKRRGRMPALIGMVIFGLPFIGCAIWYFWPSQPEQVAIAGPQPDIVVIPPSMNYLLLWNPPQQTFIRSIPLKEGKIPREFNTMAVPSPPFRVKNLGPVVAHDVHMHWEQIIDERQLKNIINKSELFGRYPAPNDKPEMNKEFTCNIPYIAPTVDNTSYIEIPIPYYMYLFAETYFTAAIFGNLLSDELITVPFRLTVSWERPPGAPPLNFIVSAIARNMHPYPIVNGEQFHDEDGKTHPMPKIMAEITFNVQQIAP
jgi:hypothetical protein